MISKEVVDGRAQMSRKSRMRSTALPAPRRRSLFGERKVIWLRMSILWLIARQVVRKALDLLDNFKAMLEGLDATV